MKKNLLLIVALLLLSGSALAQKLAPNAQAHLSWNQQENSFLRNVNDTLGNIKAFITINDESAIEKITALGGKVTVITDELLTGEIPLNTLQAIADLDEVVYVQAASPVRQLLDVAREVSHVDEAHNPDNSTGKGAFTGKDVVIGIVDGGFEFGHIDFYTSDQSTLRVKRVWDQNSKVGNSPQPYGYGTEYSAPDEIKAAKDNAAGFHATHVTGIAAGADKTTPYYGVAPDADLILVSYRDGDTDIVDAVKYCFEYAESVGKPCVVNLSLGSHYGPHDGTSVIDRAFDEMAGPGRIIVGAAGNEAQYNLHAGKTLTATNNQLKTMITYPNDAADKMRALLDVWGSVGKDIKAKAVVVYPQKGEIIKEGTELSCRLNTGDSHQLKFTTANDGINGWIGIGVTVDPNNNRPNVFVQSEITHRAENRRVGIILTGEDGDEIHLWNNYLGGLTNANVRGWTDGDNEYTVGEIGGTGKRIISVVSYTTKDRYNAVDGYTYVIDPIATGELNEISIFSSLGPTLDGRTKPDVCAPGAIVVSACSRYSIIGTDADLMVPAKTTVDNQNYYYEVNLGTSMASPFVAGTVALWLQANPNLTPEDVKWIINQSAKQDEFTGSDLPNNMWGAGKIDTYAGLLIAADPSSIEELEMAMSLLKVNADREANTLQFFFAEGEGQHDLNVTAYDAMGHYAATYHIESNGQTVSTEGLTPGLYILHVECDGTHRSVKVMW